MTYEMPIFPRPGQLLLYIDLNELAKYGYSISEALQKLEAKGYFPQLRYSQWQDSEGNSQISLFAMLKEISGLDSDPNNLIGDEADQLHEMFPEGLIVRCTWQQLQVAA